MEDLVELVEQVWAEDQAQPPSCHAGSSRYGLPRLEMAGETSTVLVGEVPSWGLC
jgi:hypothetical protein